MMKEEKSLIPKGEEKALLKTKLISTNKYMRKITELTEVEKNTYLADPIIGPILNKYSLSVSYNAGIKPINNKASYFKAYLSLPSLLITWLETIPGNGI